MTPQELKNSILQLAIQGKLVPQRAEEGTAEELYNQIQAEKQKLIKAGKIKKEKPLPEIIDDEKPFEIPDSWKWVRVTECVSNKTGLAYKKAALEKKSDFMIRVLRGGNITNLQYCFKSDDVMISSEFVKKDLVLQKNTIITPAVTSLENIGKMALIGKNYDNVVVGGFVLMLLPHISNTIFAKYLLYIFSSKYFKNVCKNITNKSGQAFYNLSREKLMLIDVPLPPLAEQKRIVAKIEELLPYVERYEKAYNELQQLNKRFSGDLQKSVLQLAIQGRLVPQCQEEGNAEDLYKQIQAEKQNLIKAGKIKKEKPLPEISDDEKPFKIPESWKWVRLGDLGFYKKGPFGSALTKSMFVSKGNGAIKVYEQKNAIKKDVKLGEYYIKREYFEEKMKGFELFAGDIIVSCAGTIGETYVMPDNFERGIINQALMKIKLFAPTYMPYFLMYFDFILKKNAKTNSKGSAIKNIPPFEILKKYLVPIPPLAEQKRIVAKLEEILPLCDKLK